MTKVFVAGHNGMVGSAICRKLQRLKDIQLVVRSRNELDLTDLSAVSDFFRSEKPDEVILAAAKVGGIYANNEYPVDFILDNLKIQNNVISCAHLFDVNKLLFLGSSCIYPKAAKQPLSEDSLLTGVLEPTNEPYAISKIAGIKLCESYNRQYGRDYRSVMPTNLYGPGDNYHPLNSHVLPALIRRFHFAKLNGNSSVSVWGSGNAMREFLYVDDLAEACLFVHNLDSSLYTSNTKTMLSHINVGSGKEVSIRDLAYLVKETIGFRGDIVFDLSKPDGTMRKLLDIGILSKLGWQAAIDLKCGIKLSYQDFLERNIVS